ncbi:MAG: hypothetical protein CFH06_00047 [Alphaproteobacteria bacterium MarineAlpha3_Bin5]|nr:hypothetical protein [Magnetovibrio sp.]PPR80161.1 MAG: hypothetical protein CFH06_00047 [Alphaproteobacteria bacterium MarineAlpha3_Bin5]
MVTESPLQYDVWIEEALRGVVKRALAMVEDCGLPGDHHFYLTFRTQEEGVSISPWTKQKYPDEMTIIIQHQYLNLRTDDRQLCLTLYFDGKQENLVIPFTAISSFADPSVNFGLQLKVPIKDNRDSHGEDDLELTETEKNSTEILEEKNDNKHLAPKRDLGEIITLDNFRKK